MPNVDESNTTAVDPTADGPTIADSVRVTPETTDEDYLEIDTESSDEVYNTSGPFATFSLSDPVESARIEQSNADVRVMGDGTVIRVEYDDEAAGESPTLFTAELFFADDSSHSIDLYATDTDVSVEAAEYAAYADFIDYTKNQAEAEGFERTPSGAMEYLQHTEERAELFDQLFTEHVLMFISLLIAASQNFVSWVVAIGIIAGLAIFLERKHGWILRLQQMAESRAELMREAVRQDYEDRRNAAAKHPLEDVTEIGPNAARYWKELGIETVDDMVEVACKGVVKTTENGRIEYDDDGNPVFAHHGVDDLRDVDPLTQDQLREQTWLAPLVLEGRLAPTTALSNIEAALLVAEKEYNRGNEVRDARRTVEELNARLAGRRDHEERETSSNAARTDHRPTGGPSPAGGD
ncbi:hypothetical protein CHINAEXTREME_20480 (plasmid) [Halobiforma lacisalsi AJ5]|uniref:Uncharacterized protein n=1 Tax=Natronobacterium lacisalsi AJ5 TaxID=358396 RepID=M0LUZ6_NATLA|nr:hypothetical protein [Halobiforma lacisalsi]APX00191.1 hypothetical protein CHINAEXTREME_20480 [Halobiforma lacisalsi AJ5]EMA37392.1 hypothetical protein C445_00846 [Halobiforma lacisalsi AJ5]